GRGGAPAGARPCLRGPRGCGLAGAGREHGDDARAVRAGLRCRVCHGHLLHQPPHRQRTGRARGRGARARHAGAAAVVCHRGHAREPLAAALTKGGAAMEWHLPVIWAALIGAAGAFYVILDGFDLGTGILFPCVRGERERDQMMSSVAPFWDGNETWLVLGGGGLWVAFPQAYAVVMPALYLPVIVMLLALVFRGVAFEFRSVAVTSKKYWNFAFAAVSTVAAICQGLILGGLIQGIKVENGAFGGGPFDWATPFALLCGLGVAVGYALLGATWLVTKTEGPVAERARAQAKALLVAVLVFMAVVSLWNPLAFERIATRWFSTPNIYFLLAVPLLTAFT